MTSDEYDEFTVAERRDEPEESLDGAEQATEPAFDARPESDDGAWSALPVEGGEPIESAVLPDEAPADVSEEEAPTHPEAEVDAGDELDAATSDQAPAGEDPFAAWPQPQSGVVIEDAPEEGASVVHVEGEIDIPDGYTVLEGVPLGRRRAVAVVVSRFNGGLTNRMLACALDELEDAEVAPDAVTVVPVPGAFELPLAAMALAKTRRYACVIALGAIVRGETPHFDYVASEAASGLQLAAIETGVPVSFGVLTVETVEQGEARIGRAADAVRSALEMADLFAHLRATAH